MANGVAEVDSMTGKWKTNVEKPDGEQAIEITEYQNNPVYQVYCEPGSMARGIEVEVVVGQTWKF
jgi:hypothetical protein